MGLYYAYLADGTKVAAASYAELYLVRYAGSLVYDDGSFESASFGGGRIIGSEAHYFLTDHLGSTRVVAKVTPTGRQDLDRKDYYPFGKAWTQSGMPTSSNRYTFSGKERNDITIDDGVTTPLHDFGARFYEPDGVTWMQQDPLMHKYYPIGQYAYCAGNPVKYIDQDGKFIGTVIGTVVGGAKGAYDAYKSGGNIWAGLGEGAVSGLITGAAIDAAVAATIATGGGALVVIGAGVAAGAAGGAVGAIAGDVTGQIVTSVNGESQNLSEAVSNVSTENFGTKAASGAISGAISGIGGAGVGLLGKSVGTAVKGVQGTMSESIESTASTLMQQGASAETVSAAVGQITKGMSKVGTRAASATRAVEITGSTTVEVTTKVIEKEIIK